MTYEVRVGSAVAHATVARGEISVAPGPDPAPDLVVNAGPGFRDVLAGLLDPDAALATGAVELIGDESLFADFVATFTVPYSAALALSIRRPGDASRLRPTMPRSGLPADGSRSGRHGGATSA